MREQKFKANTESAKKKALSTKAGNPDAKNKLKSKPPPKKKAEPVVEAVPEKKEPPVVVAPKPVVQQKKKAFVTLRTDYEVSSSSEESESESESEERGLGPKLEVKANDGALLLVRNLPKDVTTRDLLLELFHETPGIEQVSIHTDDNGISKGTADVAVSDVATARAVIKRCRKSVYRDHEIYVTLMGTSKVKTTASEVIAPMPKALRTKKEKRKKKKRRDTHKSEQKKTPPAEVAAAPAKTTSAKPAAKSDPKPRSLRMLTPNMVDPICRPWNWGTTRAANREYSEEHVPANWDEPDDTYYHVTMKKELQEHLPGV